MTDPNTELESNGQNRNPDYTLCCGGTKDEKHMIEMEFKPNATTPHWVCPKCESKSWVAGEQAIQL